MSFLVDSVTTALVRLADMMGLLPFHVFGTIAIVLVCLICAAVGSQVVGNRMAFFSDALAHCAWAGLSFTLLSIPLFGLRGDPDSVSWLLPTIMVATGTIFGVGIAFVREKTGLASDTVIGVFFAGALGFAALMFPALKMFTNKDPETFLFGSANNAEAADLIRLTGLLVLTAVILGVGYNRFVFASFNPSLARSRRIPLRLLNYVFIILLAFVVNLVLIVVGVMLVNALLIVPAATASNLSRNMRQMFWWTMALSLAAGLGGQMISLNWEPSLGRGQHLPLGAGGCIIALSVLGFAVSMIVGPRIRGRQTQ